MKSYKVLRINMKGDKTQETENRNWLSAQMVEIAEKRREAKAKASGEKYNKAFLRCVIREKEQYSNICKDTENGRKVFPKISPNLEGCSNHELDANR